MEATRENDFICDEIATFELVVENSIYAIFNKFNTFCEYEENVIKRLREKKENRIFCHWVYWIAFAIFKRKNEKSITISGNINNNYKFELEWNETADADHGDFDVWFFGYHIIIISCRIVEVAHSHRHTQV